MAGGGGPGAEHELGMMELRGDAEPRRWDRGTWIRFGLAITPLLALVVLGIVYSH
jgi:hypothetical protein